MDEIPKVKPTPIMGNSNFHGIARGNFDVHCN
jgi:hypothetical protein